MTKRSAYQAHAAGGMKALGSVYEYLISSGLPTPLMNLVYLRASQINGCAFCIDQHARDVLADGATVAKVMLLPVWREAGALFTDRERAALAWTETVTRVADTHVPDEDYVAATAQFNDAELANLTLGVALINAYNRMGISFRRAPDSLRHVASALRPEVDESSSRTVTT